MDILLKNVIAYIGIMTIWIVIVSSREHDVCFWSTFDAICEENEVIEMQHALYGRMSVGKCLPQDLGIIGCQVDVLGYLDSVCSRRQSCQLKLPQDRIASEYQPCPRGVESYLHLKYTCKAVHISPSPCRGKPLLLTKTAGLLANLITERTGQGSPECPWEVRGSPGQKVRLILHDYGVWTPPTTEASGGSGVRESETRRPAKSDVCHIYARVTDGNTKSPITLCGGEIKLKIIYLSKTESVQIALTVPKLSQHSAYFLLLYEIIGCPMYIAPEGAVFVRNDDNITVKCPDTGSEWHLVCDGARWQAAGNVTNCTGSDDPPAPIEALLEGGLTLPQGIMIIFIISIAVLIAVIILVVGLVGLRRRQAFAIDFELDTSMASSMTYPGYKCKEYIHIKANHEGAQQPPGERSYATTAQRQLVMPTGALQCRGKFAPLPLPPKDTSLEEGHCTTHGTRSHKRYQRDFSDNRLSPSHNQHINESSTFLLRTRAEPFYHELDPEHINAHTVPAQDTRQSDTDTFNPDLAAAPLPDVLTASL